MVARVYCDEQQKAVTELSAVCACLSPLLCSVLEEQSHSSLSLLWHTVKLCNQVICSLHVSLLSVSSVPEKQPLGVHMVA